MHAEHWGHHGSDATRLDGEPCPTLPPNEGGSHKWDPPRITTVHMEQRHYVVRRGKYIIVIEREAEMSPPYLRMPPMANFAREGAGLTVVMADVV